VAVHPASVEIDARNQAWAIAFGLAPTAAAAARHAAIRCASFAAHTYPRAPFDVVGIGADLITWLFLFDDQIGEGSLDADGEALTVRLMTYEETVRTGSHPLDGTVFHRALVDLRVRCLALANEDWIRRFADSLAQYFKGCVLELPFRRAQATPALGEYRGIRALSIGAYPVFDLIELALGALDESDIGRTDLYRAKYEAALLCAWVNDIYSYPKERSDQEPLNLVAVIAAERQLSPTDALVAAIELYRTDLASFETHVEAVRATSPGSALDAYLGGLEDWVHGNTAWTRLCGRYIDRIDVA
jgi:hypothetical protein